MCECTKHKCNTKGRSQWTTSKCSWNDYAKKPNHALNRSSSNITHINPTACGECSSWWQSWTNLAIWQSCIRKITMAICNPRLLFTHNQCTYTNYNIWCFQNQPLTTNINLVPTNSKMEWFQLLKNLEKLRHINQKLSNQLVSIPNLEPIKPWTRPMIIR